MEIPSLPLNAAVLELITAFPGPSPYNLILLSPTSSKEVPFKDCIVQTELPTWPTLPIRSAQHIQTTPQSTGEGEARDRSKSDNQR